MSVDLEEDFSSLWNAGWQLCWIYLGPCHWSMKIPALYFLRHMGKLDDTTTLKPGIMPGLWRDMLQYG